MQLLCHGKNHSFPNVMHLHAIESAYNIKYDDIIFLPNHTALNVINGDKAT